MIEVHKKYSVKHVKLEVYMGINLKFKKVGVFSKVVGLVKEMANMQKKLSKVSQGVKTENSVPTSLIKEN
jgi:hypothetical protein